MEKIKYVEVRVAIFNCFHLVISCPSTRGVCRIIQNTGERKNDGMFNNLKPNDT
jgi:hypothetical protein